jgi:hypothetical protein
MNSYKLISWPFKNRVRSLNRFVAVSEILEIDHVTHLFLGVAMSESARYHWKVEMCWSLEGNLDLCIMAHGTSKLGPGQQDCIWCPADLILRFDKLVCRIPELGRCQRLAHVGAVPLSVSL